MCCQRYLFIHKVYVFNSIIQPEAFLDVFAKDMNGENKINIEEVLQLQTAKLLPFLFRFQVTH